MNEDILGHDRSHMGSVLAGFGRIGAVLWGATCRRPLDALAVVVATVGATAILVNALFLQARPHPAPLLSGTSRPVATNAVAVPAPPPVRMQKPPADVPTRSVAPAAHPAAVMPPSRPAVPSAAQPTTTATLPPRAAEKSHVVAAPAARPGAPSRRVLAVQRALGDFGYGQVKPTGVLGAETKSAIERFERERKLPVTGQISDRLLRELAAITGRPIE